MLELEAAKTGKVLVIGHRGALGHAPENTMASFQKGLELGADLIELDVHMSADGALAVMHDGEVSRTTDGKGRLDTLTEGPVAPGTYRLTFDIGAYHRNQGLSVPFFPDVKITFSARDPDEHFHLPLLLSPFGYSTYRGA